VRGAHDPEMTLIERGELRFLEPLCFESPSACLWSRPGSGKNAGHGSPAAPGFDGRNDYGTVRRYGLEATGWMHP
jgi:hypothetical protein